jgi:zinc protease
MRRLMAPHAPLAPKEVARHLNQSIQGRRARLQAGAEIPLGAELKVRQYRLGNGLEVRLVIDRSAPVIGYQTWFRTGSRHERPGKTGLAHLLEHLMFNQMNSEKEVVSNERRWQVEDDVEGSMGEQLYALAFRKHPYRWPTIGYMRDIDGFTTKDCRTFYRTYYAPNNAVLVLVGDFDEEECLALIQAHYGGISATRLPKERVVTEPPQRRERRRTMRFDTEVERLALGYRGPAFATFDWVVLAVLSEVLFGGRSARLIAKLVVEQELVTSLWGAPTPFEQPSLYEIWE